MPKSRGIVCPSADRSIGYGLAPHDASCQGWPVERFGEPYPTIGAAVEAYLLDFGVDWPPWRVPAAMPHACRVQADASQRIASAGILSLATISSGSRSKS